MDRRRELLVRVYIVVLLFVLFAAAILVKVVQINVVEGEYWRKKAVNNLRWVKVEAERGDIFSDNGSSMVTSVTLFDIYMDLTVSREKDFKANIDSLSYYLEKYSNKEKSRWQWKAELTKLRKAGLEKNKAGTKYYPIASNLDYLDRHRFENFPLFRLGSLRGGIIVKSKIRRVKPYGEMASRLLGIDRKNAQNVGIEASYDEYLAGKSKEQLMKKIARGVYVPMEDVEDAQLERGYDLTTTLDVDIQDVVHNELLSAIQYHDADQATAIIMDVETGAIKAMSNLNRIENGRYGEIENVGVTRMFEPGSTIKLATVLALLEDGKAKSSSIVNLEGGRKNFYGETMHDSEPHSIYDTDLMTAFSKSSNVGIASLADLHFNDSKENRQKFIKYFKKFGLGEKSGIDLNGEPHEFLSSPADEGTKFSLTSVPWMAHGYEMRMTPLQVLAFYNAIANDGKLMAPYVVSKVMHNGETILENKPKELASSIASLSSVHEAQDMLREVVVSGTARSLYNENYGISGKTGTSKDYGVFDEGRNPYNASFAGYFPSENPKYSMIVVFFNPRNHGFYGGSVAAPVFKHVADKIFALKVDLKQDYYKENVESIASTNYRKPAYSIGYKDDFRNILKHTRVPLEEETDATWAVLNPYNENLRLEKRKIVAQSVPDVVGMGIRDAVYVLENLGLKVRFDGRGRVVSQSINPGTKINGQEIIIRLG